MHLNDIPTAVLSIVFNWLDFQSYYRLSRTDKELAKVANSSSLYEVKAKELADLKCPPSALRWVAHTNSFIAFRISAVTEDYLHNAEQLGYFRRLYEQMTNLIKLDVRGRRQIINLPGVPAIASRGTLSYFNIHHLTKLQNLISTHHDNKDPAVTLPDTLLRFSLTGRGSVTPYKLPPHLTCLSCNDKGADVRDLISTLPELKSLHISSLINAADVPVTCLFLTSLDGTVNMKSINRVVEELDVNFVANPGALLCFPNVTHLKFMVNANMVLSLVNSLPQLTRLQDLSILICPTQMYDLDDVDHTLGLLVEDVTVLLQKLRSMESLRTITLAHEVSETFVIPDMGPIKVTLDH